VTALQADAVTTLDLATVLQRLNDLGPPSEIRAHAPAEAARAMVLDRVLLSCVEHGVLTPEAVHGPDREAMLTAMRDVSISVEYPLIEGEILRRRRAQVVRADPGQTGTRRAFADSLGWTDYVTAPVLLDGRVVGFFHGDRQPSGRGVNELDAVNLGAFALCFALVFERSVLLARLRVQRQEMRQVAAWADARTSDLDDRAITLRPPADRQDPQVAGQSSAARDTALRDLLTPRELDVLELMVRGESNAAIARELVVAEGTVKFHVKNILRKLHAGNRAEATSRYLRMTLHQRGGAPSG
jgi:DNA-binding CsgD family transcriptional regulator